MTVTQDYTNERKKESYKIAKLLVDVRSRFMPPGYSEIFGIRKLASWAIASHCVHDHIFSRFGRILAFDR